MAKRQGRREDRQEAVAAVLGSTQLRRTDLYSAMSLNPTDVRNRALMMRATTGTVGHAVALNAVACASCQIRLYAPKSSGVSGKAVKKSARAWMARHSHTKAMDTAGRDDVVEVESHPALTLVRSPDPMTTSTDWMLTTYSNLESTGGAYWQKVLGDDGFPIALVNQIPWAVRIIPDERTFIAGYVVGIQSPGTRYDAEEIIYVRYRPHPFNPLHSDTWVEKVLPEADLEMAALTAERARWDNGGQPSMVFETDPAAIEVLEKKREEIMREIRGTVNAGNPLLLAGMKLIPNAVAPKDMEYTAGMDLVRKRIYAAAGIPETVWNVADSNLASATVGHPQWMGQTILPKINTVAEQLTVKLLSEWPGTEGWFFAYDNPVGEDVDASTTRVQSMATAGAASPNEWRTLNGYDAVDGGDLPLLTAGQQAELRTLAIEVAGGRMKRDSALALAKLAAPLVPMADLVKAFPQDTVSTQTTPNQDQPATANDVLPSTGDVPVGAEAVADTALNGAQVTSLVDLAAKVVLGELPMDAARAIARAAFPSVSDDVLGAIFNPLANYEAPAQPSTSAQMAMAAWKRNRRTIDKALSPSLSASLQQALQRNIAAALASGLKPDGTLDDAKLAGVLDTVAENMGELFRASVRAASDDLGLDIRAGDDQVSEWIKARGLELSTSVPDTLKQQVSNRLAELTASGELSVAEAVKAIRDEVPEIAGARAEAIARTETSLAFNEGRLTAFSEVGIDKKSWAPAGGPCPICDEFARKYEANGISVSEPFIAVVGGKTYSVNAPPAHPNCRCSLEPQL